MIESIALFFSTAYLSVVLRFRHSHRGWTTMISVAALGSLAGTIKVTTFAPFLLLGTIVIIADRWQRLKSRRPDLISDSLAIACTIILPFAITATWTYYADALKRESPIGAELTSAALLRWNFGTIPQRLSLQEYFTFYRVVNTIIGSSAIPLLAIILSSLFFRRALRPMLACLALYLISVEMFFNLHRVHGYYAYANGIFVITAVGLPLGSFVELPDRRRWVGVFAFAAVLGCCAYTYFFGHFYLRQSMYQTQELNAPGWSTITKDVKRMTREDDIIVVLGLRWSPAFAYQAQRRAIMDPWWPQGSAFLNVEHDPHLLRAAIDKQGPKSIAALIACDDARNTQRLQMALDILSIPSVAHSSGDDCDFYVRQ
jgi:hypothetical protein